MTEDIHISIWSSCLESIRSLTPETGFNTWFLPIKPIRLEDMTLTIEVPSHFFREYLEEHFIDHLRLALKKNLGVGAKLLYEIRVDSDSKPVRVAHSSSKEITNKPIQHRRDVEKISNPFIIPGLQQLNINPQLNPTYNFANFIEGECNRLGRSAGISISENPGISTFNPLFIYGGPGLGKTHLAQAIGIAIKDKYPDKIVLYVTSNRFQTQYMDAVNIKNKLTDFLHFYQMIDVLIIDDVQEFAEKPGTQNAFFQIFNHLQQNRKQLILTSDRPPVELQGLEQRLLSRFKWGLSAELSKPDYQTRIDILKSKSLKDGVELPEEVIKYLALKIDSNVRELEGILISLIAHATFNKQHITLGLAQQLIERIVTNTTQEVSIKKIEESVCKYFGFTKDALQSKTKKREIVQARQIAMYLSRNHTKNSLSSIGTQIGKKNHATVLHAYNTVCDLIDTDNGFKQYVTEIEADIFSIN